jgi:hypothetical protein
MHVIHVALDWLNDLLYSLNPIQALGFGTVIGILAIAAVEAISLRKRK